MVPKWSLLLLLALFSVEATIREAKDEEFPFHVSVKTVDNRHLCGGALITPKWVLTPKSCVEGMQSVRVACGSTDSNNPVESVDSLNIVPQAELNLKKKNSLALIELKNPVQESKTVKPAKLPTQKASELRNTTKLTGWNVEWQYSVPTNLFVSDVYFVIPRDCKTSSGTPVFLDEDQFCGVEEGDENHLSNPGAIVSKGAVVLGLLTSSPSSQHLPNIYVKMSEHERWIRDTLKADSDKVKWVDDIPKDSATASCVVSLAMIGISTVLLRFI